MTRISFAGFIWISRVCPPPLTMVRMFMADKRDFRIKRDELVDRLIGSPEYRRLLDQQVGRSTAGQSEVPRHRRVGRTA